LALNISAQTQQGSLLPASFAGWTATGPASSATGLPGIPGSPQQQAALLEEAGLISAEDRSYSKAGKRLTVALRQMRDPSSAYELYSFELRPGMNKWNAGQLAAANNSNADILVGNILVLVSGAENTSAGEIEQLVIIAPQRQGRLPWPSTQKNIETAKC